MNTLTARTSAADLFSFSLVDSTCEMELMPVWADSAECSCYCDACASKREREFSAFLDRLIEERESADRDVEGYFSEVRYWEREERAELALLREEDEIAARRKARADKAMIDAWLAG